MKIEDFSYIRCTNCKNVIIFPIPYENNHYLLSDMCNEYNEMNECCNDTHVLSGDIEFGIEGGYIKISDLPIKLRKEFPLKVTHGFDCGKHSLVVTKYNGDKVIVSIEGDYLTIDDGHKVNNIHIQFMDD